MRLRTFGGLSLEADPEVPPAAPLSPRRLALLALVAAAEPRGITRDKILGILWAEREEEQARHTLSQNLYSLRRELGRDCIVGTSQLRLAPSVTADVIEFRAALQAGDPATAVGLYAGSFLDGFYLAGAQEFERWVEAERAKLQAAAISALESLAKRAASHGSNVEASGWLRRLLVLDPYRDDHAGSLIQTLVAGDQRSVALQFAQEYEERLRRDLDSAPGPGFQRLVSALRTTPAVAQSAPPPPTTPVGADLPTAPVVSTVGTKPTMPAPPGRRRLVLAIGAVVATALAVWGFDAGRSLRRGSPPLLAIGPIRTTTGATPGPMLRDMLATNLARVQGIRVLANTRFLELVPAGSDTLPGAVMDGARRAGVDEMLEGELMADRDELVLSLRLIDTRSGVVKHGYLIRGSDPASLVDSATAVIARGFRLGPPWGTVTAVRTASPAAYALYLEGLRAFYQWSDAAAAYRLMAAAVESDSGFAMAAYYAWRMGKLAGRSEEADRARELAGRLALRATDRERLLIQGGIEEFEAPVGKFLDTAKELTSRFPDDPDGQIMLGLAYFSAGDWAASVAAYERAVQADSAGGAAVAPYCRICAAIGGMADAYMWWDSTAAAERTGRRLIAMRPGDGSAWASVVEALLRMNRWSDAELAIANADARYHDRFDFSSTLDRGLIRSGRFTELDAKLESDLRRAPPESPTEAPWLLTISLRNQGRFKDAVEVAERAGIPGTSIRLQGPPDQASLAIIALERGDVRSAARMFSELVALDRALGGPVGYQSKLEAWHMTLAATALAAAGDTATVRELADSVERIGPFAATGRNARLHYFLRGLILARQGRHADAVDAYRRSLFSLTDGYTRTNLEMARSLLALGRSGEAIDILRPALRGGVDGSNSYLTHTELHEALAQAFERAGMADSAKDHYRAVEQAWRWADPELADRYRIARLRAGLPESPLIRR